MENFENNLADVEYETKDGKIERAGGFELSQHIKVQRSSGEIEDDWSIASFKIEGGTVHAIVLKTNENGQLLRKRVRVLDLQGWNA